MHALRLPSLILSLFLQAAPLLRVVGTEAALAVSPIAAVLRFLAGAAAVAGTYHGVSGATAPTLSSSKTRVGALGVSLNYRILLSGGSPEAFTAEPLPPGLTLNLVRNNQQRVTGAEIRGLPDTLGETKSLITAWDNEDFTGDTTSGEVVFLIVDIAPLEPSVPLGGSVTFTVPGPQTVAVRYRWIHNDIEVPDPLGTNASLTLPAVTEADAGQYRVRVNFGNTSVFTRRSTLTVTPGGGAPTLTEQPGGARLHLGESLSLRCAATGDGPLTFAWKRGETTLEGQSDAVLTIPEVSEADAGDYRVTVTGTGGSVTSDPATVTVDGILRISGVGREASEVVIPFNGIPSRSYLLERRDTLTGPDWVSAGEQVAGEAPAFRVAVPETDHRMFRVRTP
ncbi:MAG: immunoglobulin domain-containing protein [Verrucomicrobia bacterium]|nr:immunoglobulin domain-containing protein [Verrucomicrobiota bacterium]